MFIQNQIGSLPNHLKKIKSLLNDADKAFLTVAYIRNSGVDELLENFKVIVAKGGKIKLICSNDMGITQPSAIKRLLDIGVEVKICKFDTGTFHAKIWLAEKNSNWACLVGSANCSRAAFLQNVEASLFIDSESNIHGAIEQSLMFFEYLWNNNKCFDVNTEVLLQWQQRKQTRQEVKQEISDVKFSPEGKKVYETLFDFIKSWVGISKEKKQQSDFINSLWRGWYIIPDQGIIDDNLMASLQNIASELKKKSVGKGYVDISKNSKELDDILRTLKAKFKRSEHKMALRDLFVRQEKNYLIRLGFASQSLKDDGKKEDDGKLVLTESGNKFADCNDQICQKNIYTSNLSYKTWGSLFILAFAIRLLIDFEYISLAEFYLFVMHTDSMSDLTDTKDLIAMFRKLTFDEQGMLVKEFNKYFDQIKGATAKNVRGNFIKHAKHTMSAIGWVNGLFFDQEKFQLQIQDKKQISKILDNLDQ